LDWTFACPDLSLMFFKGKYAIPPRVPTQLSFPTV
jgi:hypothetical protein